MLRGLHNWLYPELALFPSEDARRDAELATGAVVFESPVYVIWILANVAMVLCCCLYRTALIAVPAMVILAVVAFGGLVAIKYVGRSKFRSALRECLREQGIPICIPCGYDLQGRAGDNCPECGQPHGLARAGEQVEQGKSERER